MLTQVAEGVFTYESVFCQSNAVVIDGPSGALLVDAGVRGDEMVCLADDLSELGLGVAVGFSTHPHWDHLLWHARLGVVPRYGTARCAATAEARLSDPGSKSRVVQMMPPDLVDQVPLDLLGGISGLPADATVIPWDGARIRIIEHVAHAPGHAALFVEDRGVLVAGDMLSDVLVPILDFTGTDDPIEDYLAALGLLESVADDVDVLVPGHGSVCGADQVRARIEQDRAYVRGLRDGDASADPRVGPSAAPGWEWVRGVYERQLEQFGRRTETDTAAR